MRRRVCGEARRHSRRQFLALTAFTGPAALLAGRVLGGSQRPLSIRPQKPTQTIGPGQHRLGLADGRDGLLYVPKSYRPDARAPLAVMLHGAGGTSKRMAFTHAAAEEFGVVLLIPESRDPRSWDIIVQRQFGDDLAFIERALTYTFDRCAIDPRKLSVGGFSDGASYALTLGLTFGELFTHIIAFSPGFNAARERRGSPRIFVSHGTGDEILPIQNTSRRLVPLLKRSGYDVLYREFDGPHTIPPPVTTAAFKWLSA
jgi:phospholipase/carboxylesterase